MSFIGYRDHELFCENIALSSVATKFGTPCYIYSKQALVQNWQNLYQPLVKSKRPFKIYYAVKANSNLAILQQLAKLGAGFDVVSVGEIERVLAAGGKADDIVFAGVGKSIHEIDRAIELGIHSIHVESEQELERINQRAIKANTKVNIAFRVNPDITVDTHSYISTGSKDNKFGIDHNRIIPAYVRAKSLPNIQIKGIACHIGSQLLNLEPFVSAAKQLLRIIQELKAAAINLEYIDLGGGLGIQYANEAAPSAQAYITALLDSTTDCNIALHIEPGRSLVANIGLLLTRIEYIKTTDDNNFAIVDAGMNDLVRPALYSSYHKIQPVIERGDTVARDYAIVGPVCESGDFFAINPKRTLKIKDGDLLAILDCGAYGFSMSSNYNSRAKCAEVLIDGDQVHLIGKRQSIAQLFENEVLIDA